MNELLAKLIFGEQAQAKEGLSNPTLQMLMGNKFNMTAPENLKPVAKKAVGKGKTNTQKQLDDWEKEYYAREEKAKADADAAAAKLAADEAEARRVASLTPQQRRQEEAAKAMKDAQTRMTEVLKSLSAGESANLRASMPYIMSPLESEIAAGNAKAAIESLGIGKAEKELLDPYYDDQRKLAEDEINSLKGERDLTGLFHALDYVSGQKSGYKFTAGDKIKELRKRIDEQMKGRGDLANKQDALLEKFYSASKLSPLSFGYGASEAAPRTGGGGEKKLKTIPAGQAEKLGAGYELPNRIQATIDFIAKNASKMGRLNQAGDWIAATAGWESESSELKAMLESLKQDIGKAKEGGVLRKEDEIKYGKLLPNLGSNPYTALKNLKLMIGEVASKVKAHKDSLGRAGYDVSGYAGMSENLPTGSISKGGLSAEKQKRLDELRKKLGK